MNNPVTITLNKKFYVFVVALVMLLSVAAGLMVYTGIYSVSALTGHTKPVYTFLEYARIRSVSIRAPKISPNLEDLDWRRAGVQIYEQHCLKCHGAPGVAPEPFSLGMMPPPSAIVRVARQRSVGELFWVVENGIKMSGMPAWKYRLTEQELWVLVALLKQIPKMDKTDYAELRSAVNDEHVSSHSPSRISNIAPNRAANATEFDGRVALQQYNCVSCHSIAGMPSADYFVGPPLTNMVKRSFIAGVLPMTRENLVQWIIRPTHFKAQSLMPGLGVKRDHAEAMVDYLFEIAD